MTLEVFVGRSLACCAHPAAAWRVLSPTKRALLCVAYAGAGYVGGLLLLVMM